MNTAMTSEGPLPDSPGVTIKPPRIFLACLLAGVILHWVAPWPVPGLPRSFGLAAGLWSGDRQRAMRMVRRLRSGVVWLDSYNHFDPLVPFGGIKHSGGGSREWSHLALDCFVDVKTVWEVM